MKKIELLIFMSVTVIITNLCGCTSNKESSITISSSSKENIIIQDDNKKKEETVIKNDEIKKDFREAMFECIQYFREAGHLKDLDNSYK